MNEELALENLRPLLIVSPHSDDGVSSCGELLAALPGTTVATVFGGPSGTAEAIDPPAANDGGAFAATAAALRARRDAQDEALALLGAQSASLGFVNARYGCGPSVITLADRLDELIAMQRPRSVMMPLGLFHADHLLTHAACFAVRERYPTLLWLAYADARYRHLDGLLQDRLASLRAASTGATPLFFGIDGAERARLHALKQRALSACAGPAAAAGVPESYWRLSWRARRAHCAGDDLSAAGANSVAA